MANYKITQDDGFFHLKFLAQVELDTVQEAYFELLRTQGFMPESHTLWNFENAILLLSITDMHQIADAVIAAADLRASSARSAFFVPDAHDAALLKNYITLVAHYPVEFRLFSDYSESVAWLRSTS